MGIIREPVLCVGPRVEAPGLAVRVQALGLRLQRLIQGSLNPKRIGVLNLTPKNPQP